MEVCKPASKIDLHYRKALASPVPITRVLMFVWSCSDQLEKQEHHFRCVVQKFDNWPRQYNSGQKLGLLKGRFDQLHSKIRMFEYLLKVTLRFGQFFFRI